MKFLSRTRNYRHEMYNGIFLDVQNVMGSRLVFSCVSSYRWQDLIIVPQKILKEKKEPDRFAIRPFVTTVPECLIIALLLPHNPTLSFSMEYTLYLCSSQVRRTVQTCFRLHSPFYHILHVEFNKHKNRRRQRSYFMGCDFISLYVEFFFILTIVNGTIETEFRGNRKTSVPFFTEKFQFYRRKNVVN